MKAEEIQTADDLEAWLNGLPDDAERVKLVTQIVYRQAWTNLARLSQVSANHKTRPKRVLARTTCPHGARAAVPLPPPGPCATKP